MCLAVLLHNRNISLQELVSMNKKHLYSPDEDIAITIKAVEPAKSAVSVEVKTFSLNKRIPETFSLDKTPLQPNSTTMLAHGMFESTYLKQLEKLIYNDMDKLDTDALMTLTSLSDIVEHTHRPIRLMSQAFRKKLPTICKVLNEFYANNRSVIRGIAQQLAN